MLAGMKGAYVGNPVQTRNHLRPFATEVFKCVGNLLHPETYLSFFALVSDRDFFCGFAQLDLVDTVEFCEGVDAGPYFSRLRCVRVELTGDHHGFQLAVDFYPCPRVVQPGVTGGEAGMAFRVRRQFAPGSDARLLARRRGQDEGAEFAGTAHLRQGVTIGSSCKRAYLRNICKDILDWLDAADREEFAGIDWLLRGALMRSSGDQGVDLLFRESPLIPNLHTNEPAVSEHTVDRGAVDPEKVLKLSCGKQICHWVSNDDERCPVQ